MSYFKSSGCYQGSTWIMHYVALPSLIGLLCLASPLLTMAQSPTPPLQIELVVERVHLDRGEPVQALIALRNTSPYTLTDIEIIPMGKTFSADYLSGLLTILPPFKSHQAEFELTTEKVGENRAIFVVSYKWQESPTENPKHRVETVTADIAVEKRFDFDWPEYLIPLIFGFCIGKFGTWLDERRKQRTEDRKLEQQVRGVTLALLQTSRKGIEKREEVSYGLWEEAVIKGNLYPALQRLARNISKPGFACEIAEVSIKMTEYNRRVKNKNLTDGYTGELIEQLTALIRQLENIGGLI